MSEVSGEVINLHKILVKQGFELVTLKRKYELFCRKYIHVCGKYVVDLVLLLMLFLSLTIMCMFELLLSFANY